MPRKPVIASDYFPFFVSARANNKEWFYLPLPYVYGIFANIMEATIKRYKIRCQGFVLMSNHFHMLVATPEANLSQAMRFFMTETSRAITRASKRINRIYGARYHWNLIQESEHYAHAYMYLYRNPVKADIVDRVEAYPFSTLRRRYQKFARLIVPDANCFDEYIPANHEELLAWLNQEEDGDYTESVRRALRKTEFSFGQDKYTGKKCTYIDKLHPKKSPGT